MSEIRAILDKLYNAPKHRAAGAIIDAENEIIQAPIEDEQKPLFTTEHGGRLFKVLGGETIELPDGSKIIMNPDAVIDAPNTESTEDSNG